jgi:hypothetical protein
MADNLRRSDPWLAMMRLAVIIAAATAAGCSQQKVADSPGDPDLAKPSADECQIARAAITAVHAANLDARWRSAGSTNMSVRTNSQVINPADFPAYADDEEADLLGKGPADWRWCAGMGAFLGGLRWKPMGPDEDVAAVLGLGRPAMNKTGDEAKVYEIISAPVDGGMRRAAGPWVATLRRGPSGWQVASTDAAKKS